MNTRTARSRQGTVLSLAALALTLLFSAAPAHALSESQQDAAIANLQSVVAALQNKVNVQASQITTLQSTVSILQRKTAAIVVATDPTRSDHLKSTELIFTGVNIHIFNGLGATNGKPNSPYDTSSPVTNGLGNLILGYYETRGGNSDTHTGSHNLILGQQNNYSSYGGIVAGLDNLISAPFASVTGGDYNTASSLWASVSGGYQNTADGVGSSVSGGYDNIAGGYYAEASGGYFNYAENTGVSISGGDSCTADGIDSSVSGGKDVSNPQDYEWAAGTYHSQ